MSRLRQRVVTTLALQRYEVVVNLLPGTSPKAIPGEQQIAESQAIER